MQNQGIPNAPYDQNMEEEMRQQSNASLSPAIAKRVPRRFRHMQSSQSSPMAVEPQMNELVPEQLSGDQSHPNHNNSGEGSQSASSRVKRVYRRRKFLGRGSRPQGRRAKSIETECIELLDKAAQGVRSIKPNQVKYATLTKYIMDKACEVCGVADKDEHQLVLCDRCDDAYHLNCAGLENNVVSEIWYCKACIEDMNNSNIAAQSQVPENCEGCNKALESQLLEYHRPPFNRRTRVTEFVESSTFRCKYCHKYFHETCLNERQQALNCTACENLLRKATPKGHSQYLEYIKKCTKRDAEFQKNYMLLSNKTDESDTESSYSERKLKYLGLKLPDTFSSPVQLAKHEASIFYALSTQRMIFTDEQIYPVSPSRIDLLNDTKAIKWNVKLNEKDEEVFQAFKKQTNMGFYGAMEICQDKIRGFYVRALDVIPERTLLCEYVGQVVTMRESLTKDQNNSIFSLIRTTRSTTSLDICPEKYGNIAKFFCGVNNATRKMENTQTMLINYKGHGRILFFAKRKIIAGEILCIDYNAGAFQQYPTQNFK